MNTKRMLVLMTACFLLFSSTLIAQDENSKDDGADKFTELTEGATKHEGFFTLYHTPDEGKLYMAVPEDMLGKDFLLDLKVSEGIGSAFIFGGQMLTYSLPMMTMDKQEGKIFLKMKTPRYTAEENTPEAHAVDITFGESVIETASVEATNDEGVMLINVYDWFVSDMSGIGQRIEGAVASRPGVPGRASFDKSRSYLKQVKSFPQNTNIEASLTFRNGGDRAPRSVADARFIPVSIYYNFVALPEEPMQPRMADDRLGYFMTVHKDFTNKKGDDSFFNRYVNKWRLECADEPAADGLCTPKKPITYYIDRTVPEQFIQPLMEGVEAWSEAYEAAGFRDAVQAEMLPDSADAEDIRYPTLRWNTNDQTLYGAIGPSATDPRTGEILDADILFEANMFLGTRADYREIVEPRAAIDQIFELSEEELKELNAGGESKLYHTNLSMQMKMAEGFMKSRLGKEALRDGLNMQEFVHQFARWVTMHEVGHTLGLRHNFRGSVDTPLDQLYSEDWGEDRGVFNSAMEYPTVNLSPEGEAQDGYYYNPGVGSYDKWVISYGYTPDDEDAEEIARQVAQPGHAYATDGDARGASAIDPLVNVYDLGEDPLAWGKNRADLIRELIPGLVDVALEDNEAYYHATDLFNSYFFSYATTMAPAVKYLGGQYQYRDHVGDPDGRMPFEAVSKEKQEEALQMIVDYAFDQDALQVPPALYQQFGANRWDHFGNSTTYRGRIDYPLHDYLLGVQTSLLAQLLNGTRLSRIRDTEVKFGADNTVTIPELMGAITEAIWEEAWVAPGTDIESNRRDLQRAYLDGMIGIVVDAPSNMPADARSVARHTLSDLHERISRRLTPPANFDAYTEAHLQEAKVRIEKALDAGLDLEN